MNVGVADERSIKEIAEIICQQSNITGNLVLEDAPQGSVSRREGDVTKLKSLTNFQPKVSLEEGIRLTLESL